MSRNNMSDAESFFETASKEELINYLVQTIQKEVSKGDDADCDLVRECSDWLEELTEDEIVFTPEELEQKLAELKAGSTSEKPVTIRQKPSPKTFVRVALIAAVIFAISLASLSALAVNRGYGSAWEYISVNVEKMFGLNHGEEINDDSITVIKNAESIKYNSIDEFINSESLLLLYPQPMPNDVKVRQIRFEYESETKYVLYFDLSNKSYAFYVSNYYSVEMSTLYTLECVSVNNQDFFISQKDENTYYALFQNSGFEYTIQAPNYDELLAIIYNMKGL